MDTTDAFLALSPEGFASFCNTSPPPPSTCSLSSGHDFAFAHILDTPTTPNLSLAFPQASQEYPPLMSPELMALFGATEIIPNARHPVPQFMVSQDVVAPHSSTALSFPPELLAQVATAQTVQPQYSIITNPHLDIKGEGQDTPCVSYMDFLSQPLPFQTTLNTISPRTTCAQPSSLTPPPYTLPQDAIKQESLATPQSSALQKLHQRLLQRLRKSQADGPAPVEQEQQMHGEGEMLEPAQLVVSENSKKADSSFTKVLELFSYYFNTQKTASPLACTAALYLFSLLFSLCLFVLHFFSVVTLLYVVVVVTPPIQSLPLVLFLFTIVLFLFFSFEYFVV